MKPGGLCSPSDGSSTPSGDGINNVSAAFKTLDDGSQFPDASTSEESPACLTPDLFEDRHQGARSSSSIANGFVCNDVTNGLCKDIDVPRHVLSPPSSEDGEERSSASRRISGNTASKDSGTSTLYQGSCSKGPSSPDARSLDPTPRAKSLPPKTSGISSEESPAGTSEHSSSSVCNASSDHEVAVSGDSSKISSLTEPQTVPQNIKSPKYRRKCSLEEMVAKLYNRTEPILSGINALKGFPNTATVGDPDQEKTANCVHEREGVDEPSSSCQSEHSQSRLCDNSNTAMCDAHPSKDSSIRDVLLLCNTRGDSGETVTLFGDRSCVNRSSLCESCCRTSEEVGPSSEKCNLPNQSESGEDSVCQSETSERHLRVCSNLEDNESARTSENKDKVGERTVLTDRTEISTCVSVASVSKDAQINNVLMDVSRTISGEMPAEKDAKLESEQACGARSPTPESCSIKGISDKSSVHEAADRDTREVFDLTSDKDSVRSSVIDLIDDDTRDSGSDLEILFDKRKEMDGSKFMSASRSESSNEKQLRGKEDDRVHDKNSKRRSERPIMPSIVNSDNRNVQYLEPISDDENSLICAPPSPPSDFSSVSGIPSNSDTPLFSDTPSDASRGAIMIKISDAVAAILSDVSDDSLPPSPVACDVQSTFSKLIPKLVEADGKCNTGSSDVKESSASEKCSSRCHFDKESESGECKKVPANGVVSDADDSESDVGDGKCNKIEDKMVSSPTIGGYPGHKSVEYPEKDLDAGNSRTSEQIVENIANESPKDIECAGAESIDKSIGIGVSHKQIVQVNLPSSVGKDDDSSDTVFGSLLSATIDGSLHQSGPSTSDKCVVCRSPSHSCSLHNAASCTSSDPCNTNSLCQNSTSGSLCMSSQQINCNTLSSECGKNVASLDCKYASIDTITDTLTVSIHSDEIHSAGVQHRRKEVSAGSSNCNPLIPVPNARGERDRTENKLDTSKEYQDVTKSLFISGECDLSGSSLSSEITQSLNDTKVDVTISAPVSEAKHAIVEANRRLLCERVSTEVSDKVSSECSLQSKSALPLAVSNSSSEMETLSPCEGGVSDRVTSEKSCEIDVQCKSVDKLKDSPSGSIYPASTCVAIHSGNDSVSNLAFCEGRSHLQSSSDDSFDVAESAFGKKQTPCEIPSNSNSELSPKVVEEGIHSGDNEASAFSAVGNLNLGNTVLCNPSLSVTDQVLTVGSPILPDYPQQKDHCPLEVVSSIDDLASEDQLREEFVCDGFNYKGKSLDERCSRLSTKLENTLSPSESEQSNNDIVISQEKETKSINENSYMPTSDRGDNTYLHSEKSDSETPCNISENDPSKPATNEGSETSSLVSTDVKRFDQLDSFTAECSHPGDTVMENTGERLSKPTASASEESQPLQEIDDEPFPAFPSVHKEREDLLAEDDDGNDVPQAFAKKNEIPGAARLEIPSFASTTEIKLPSVLSDLFKRAVKAEFLETAIELSVDKCPVETVMAVGLIKDTLIETPVEDDVTLPPTEIAMSKAPVETDVSEVPTKSFVSETPGRTENTHISSASVTIDASVESDGSNKTPECILTETHETDKITPFNTDMTKISVGADMIKPTSEPVMTETSDETDMIKTPAELTMIETQDETNMNKISAELIMIETSDETDMSKTPAKLVMIETSVETDMRKMPAELAMTEASDETGMTEASDETGMSVTPAESVMTETPVETDMTKTPAEFVMVETDMTKAPAESIMVETSIEIDMTKTPAESVLVETDMTKTLAESVLVETDMTKTLAESVLVETDMTKTPAESVMAETSVETDMTKTSIESVMVETSVETNMTKTPAESVMVETSVETNMIKTPAESVMIETTVETDVTKTPVELANIEIPVKTDVNKTPEELSTIETPNETDRSKTPVESVMIETPNETDMSKTSAKLAVIETPDEADTNRTLMESVLTEAPVETDLTQTSSEPVKTETPFEIGMIKMPVEAEMSQTLLESGLTETPVETDMIKTPAESVKMETPVEIAMTNVPSGSAITKALVKTNITPVESVMNEAPVETRMCKTLVKSVLTETIVGTDKIEVTAESVMPGTPIESGMSKTPVQIEVTKVPAESVMLGTPVESGMGKTPIQIEGTKVPAESIMSKTPTKSFMNETTVMTETPVETKVAKMPTVGIMPKPPVEPVMAMLLTGACSSSALEDENQVCIKEKSLPSIECPQKDVQSSAVDRTRGLSVYSRIINDPMRSLAIADVVLSRLAPDAEDTQQSDVSVGGVKNSLDRRHPSDCSNVNQNQFSSTHDNEESQASDSSLIERIPASGINSLEDGHQFEMGSKEREIYLGIDKKENSPFNLECVQSSQPSDTHIARSQSCNKDAREQSHSSNLDIRSEEMIDDGGRIQSLEKDHSGSSLLSEMVSTERSEPLIEGNIFRSQPADRSISEKNRLPSVENVVSEAVSDASTICSQPCTMIDFDTQLTGFVNAKDSQMSLIDTNDKDSRLLSVSTAESRLPSALVSTEGRSVPSVEEPALGQQDDEASLVMVTDKSSDLKGLFDVGDGQLSTVSSDDRQKTMVQSKEEVPVQSTSTVVNTEHLSKDSTKDIDPSILTEDGITENQSLSLTEDVRLKVLDKSESEDLRDLKRTGCDKSVSLDIVAERVVSSSEEKQDRSAVATSEECIETQDLSAGGMSTHESELCTPMGAHEEKPVTSTKSDDSNLILDAPNNGNDHDNSLSLKDASSSVINDDKLGECPDGVKSSDNDKLECSDGIESLNTSLRESKHAANEIADCAVSAEDIESHEQPEESIKGNPIPDTCVDLKESILGNVITDEGQTPTVGSGLCPSLPMELCEDKQTPCFDDNENPQVSSVSVCKEDNSLVRENVDNTTSSVGGNSKESLPQSFSAEVIQKERESSVCSMSDEIPPLPLECDYGTLQLATNIDECVAKGTVERESVKHLEVDSRECSVEKSVYCSASSSEDCHHKPVGNTENSIPSIEMPLFKEKEVQLKEKVAECNRSETIVGEESSSLKSALGESPPVCVVVPSEDKIAFVGDQGNLPSKVVSSENHSGEEPKSVDDSLLDNSHHHQSTSRMESPVEEGIGADLSAEVKGRESPSLFMMVGYESSHQVAETVREEPSIPASSLSKDRVVPVTENPQAGEISTTEGNHVVASVDSHKDVTSIGSTPSANKASHPSHDPVEEETHPPTEVSCENTLVPVDDVLVDHQPVADISHVSDGIIQEEEATAPTQIDDARPKIRDALDDNTSLSLVTNSASLCAVTRQEDDPPYEDTTEASMALGVHSLDGYPPAAQSLTKESISHEGSSAASAPLNVEKTAPVDVVEENLTLASVKDVSLEDIKEGIQPDTPLTEHILVSSVSVCETVESTAVQKNESPSEGGLSSVTKEVFPDSKVTTDHSEEGAPCTTSSSASEPRSENVAESCGSPNEPALFQFLELRRKDVPVNASEKEEVTPSYETVLFQSLNMRRKAITIEASHKDEAIVETSQKESIDVNESDQKIHCEENKFDEVLEEPPPKEDDGTEKRGESGSGKAATSISQTTELAVGSVTSQGTLEAVDAAADGEDSSLVKVVEVKREVCFTSEDSLGCSEDFGGDSLKAVTDPVSSCTYNVKGGVITILEDKTESENPEPQTVDSLCPLCREILAEPLEEHIIEHHTCVSFIPAKSTSSYHHHMLQRVNDTIDTSHTYVMEEERSYVCRSCHFSSKDINSVRFHLNIHEDVFQVRTGKSTCVCNQKVYSYQFHRWKSLIHSSIYYCVSCNYYFACEKSLFNHLTAMHYPQNLCKVCKHEVSQEDFIVHSDLHKNEASTDEVEAELPESQITTRSKGSYGISWNIYDNSLNYLDGKHFRLSVATKVVDSTHDRGYLTLPIKNVLEVATVPDKVKLDPAKDIRKYLQGKKDIRASEEEINDVLKNFNWFVQMHLEKKTGRKGKNSSGASRSKRENDLFDVLGIRTVRSRASSRKEGGTSHDLGKSLRKKGANGKQEPPTEDLKTQLANLTRTRSGMQPTKDENETDRDAIRDFAFEMNVSVNGEWSKEHTYICCSCGAGYLDLADIMDHKWELHPSVWCAHTMFQGQDSIPLSFCNQFQPPTSRPSRLPLAAVPSTPGTQAGSSQVAQDGADSKTENADDAKEKGLMVCSRCSLTFLEKEGFHSHLVECGGLNQMVIVKKKNKKGFRFKRRKGQGVPNNRYGISSHPSTPLKAKFGDRSSGLNTPLLDKSHPNSIQSSGVKRRLELAIGSINNHELKNRLKAIITGTKSSAASASFVPGRRTIRMKLRKKGLDNRRLRKTRHSDKVKEDPGKKIEEPSKTAKGDEKKAGSAREEKVEMDGQPSKKVIQRKGSAEDSKVKKPKDVADRSDGVEASKNKLQKSRLSGGKKGGNVSESAISVDSVNVTTSTAAEVASDLMVTKKKSKNQNQVSKKLQTEKKVNGLINVNKRQNPSDLKSLESNTTDSKTIDVKKVLAKKLLAKKSKNTTNVNLETVSDKVINFVASGSLIGNKEISVQKRMKQSGKLKPSKITPLKTKEANKATTATTEKPKSKKSKAIDALQSKKNILKSKLGIGKSSNVSNIVAADKTSKSKGIKKTGQTLPVTEQSVKETPQTLPVTGPLKKTPPVLPATGSSKNLLQKKKGKEVPKEIQAQAKPTNSTTGKAKTPAKPSDVVPASSAKKTKYLLSSSNEEVDEDSEDSEPEVIRNFRSGRGCTGRTGLRNKRRPMLSSRYSFRTCLESAENETETEATAKEEITEQDSPDTPSVNYQERDVSLDKENELSDNIPLSPKRKRKIANYENQDDCAYVPDENSSDTDEDLALQMLSPAKEKNVPTRKRRKVLQPPSELNEAQADLLEQETPVDAEVESQEKENTKISNELPSTVQNGAKAAKRKSQGKGQKKPVISVKGGLKKGLVKKARVSKPKISQENADLGNMLKSNFEDISESDANIQQISKPVKKQRSKAKAILQAEELLESQGVIEETGQKPPVKKRTKPVAVGGQIMLVEKGPVKVSKSKVSKSQSSVVTDSKTSIQNPKKRGPKKTATSVKAKEDVCLKYSSNMIAKKSQDILNRIKNIGKMPGKVKERSRSITLGNLSRTEEVNKKGMKTMKKCSSMSNIPQDLDRESATENAKRKSLVVRSLTASDLSVGNDGEASPVSPIIESAPNLPDQVENLAKLKGKRQTPIGLQSGQRRRNQGKKKINQVPVLASLEDTIFTTSQNVSEDFGESALEVPGPILPPSVLRNEKSKVVRVGAQKTKGKKAKQMMITSENLQHLGSLQASKSSGPHSVKKPRKRNKVNKAESLKVTELSVESAEPSEIIDKGVMQPASVLGKALPRRQAVVKGKNPKKKKNSVELTPVTSTANITEDFKKCSDLVLSKEDASTKMESFSSNDDSILLSKLAESNGVARKSRKRKLSVKSMISVCADSIANHNVEPTGVFLPSKKTKKLTNTSQKKVKSSHIPNLTKVLKGKKTSKSNQLLNNHVVNQKLGRGNNGRFKQPPGMPDKGVAEIRLRNPRTVKDNKENDLTFDAMPVLEPMNVAGQSSTDAASYDNGGGEGDGTYKISARIKRRRSSVEKIKDIPTRSSANVIVQESSSLPLLQAVIDEQAIANEGLVIVSEENSISAVSSKGLKNPELRKRRTQSSHEIRVNEESDGQSVSHSGSVSKSSKGTNDCHGNAVLKRPAERKRAASTSGVLKKESLNLARQSQSEVAFVKENDNSIALDKAKKASPKKRKAPSVSKKSINDLKCLDCGLSFDSLTSIEDHRQDCNTIAFEMSLMEAEDHLFECQHCHLTFALKGTHRQHTASCRLGKHKRPLQKHNDSKVRRRTSGRVPNSQVANVSATNPEGMFSFAESLPKDEGDDIGIVEEVDRCLASAPVDNKYISHVMPEVPENVLSDCRDSRQQEFVPSVAGSSKADHTQELSPTKSKGPPKCRKRSRTNGKVDHTDITESVSSSIASEQKCVVCGCEIKDEDMSNKHLLLEQFSHSCQQQPVLEVCVLLAYYNLSMESVRSLVTSAIFYQGSTILKLDAKQQTSPDLDPCLSNTENKSASQLQQILASPHCMWVSSVLEAIAKHYYSIEAVSISGTRQESLKAITALEELFKEIANIDSTMRKNQMLRTMKETFEAGTL